MATVPGSSTLVNINDWCKNSFEVINRLRINSDYRKQRYDILLLTDGVSRGRIEPKTLINLRQVKQIVQYKRYNSCRSGWRWGDT